MVTHNLPLVSKLAGLVVVVSAQGEATVLNTVEEGIAEDIAVRNEAVGEEEKGEDAIRNKHDDVVPKLGKLIVDEEVALNHVSVTSSKWQTFQSSKAFC